MTIMRTNVAAVIFDPEGRVFLAKRSMRKQVAPGAWHLPGGKVEEGETLADAIARELREEFGFAVGAVRETGVAHPYTVGDETHQTVFVRVETRGIPVLNHENDAIEFVALADIGNYLEPELLSVNLAAIAKAR